MLYYKVRNRNPATEKTAPYLYVTFRTYPQRNMILSKIPSEDIECIDIIQEPELNCQVIYDLDAKTIEYNYSIIDPGSKEEGIIRQGDELIANRVTNEYTNYGCSAATQDAERHIEHQLGRIIFSGGVIIK